MSQSPGQNKTCLSAADSEPAADTPIGAEPTLTEDQRRFCRQHLGAAIRAGAHWRFRLPRVAIPEDAIEDAVIDGLLRAARTWKPGTSSPSSWVITCVRWQVMSYMNRYRFLSAQRRQDRNAIEHPLSFCDLVNPGSAGQPDPGFLGSGDQEEEAPSPYRRQLRDLLPALPRVQREVLGLVLDGWSIQDIAQLRGRAPGSIRNCIGHAMKRLRVLASGINVPPAP